MTPASFPYSKVTHVDIGNVHVTAAGCCTPPPGAAAAWASYAPATVNLAHAAGRKVLLQLGGSDNTPEGWKAGTATPAATTTLADSIVGYALSAPRRRCNDRLGAGRRRARRRRARPCGPHLMAEGDHHRRHRPLRPRPQLGFLGGTVRRQGGRDDLRQCRELGRLAGPWHQGALYGDTALDPFSVNRKVRALIAAGLSPHQVGIGIGLFGTGYGDSNGDGRCPTSPTGGWAGETGP